MVKLATEKFCYTTKFGLDEFGLKIKTKTSVVLWFVRHIDHLISYCVFLLVKYKLMCLAKKKWPTLLAKASQQYKRKINSYYMALT